MTLTDYKTHLQIIKLYPYDEHYFNINNAKYKLILTPDPDAFCPQLRTIIFSWDRQYSCGDYNHTGADNFLYNYLQQSLPTDTFNELLPEIEVAESASEWYVLLQQVPNVQVTRLCIYEHSGATLYPAPRTTDAFDTRCTMLAVYEYDNTLPVQDNVSIGNQEIETYCAYFNGEVYALTLYEPVTCTLTRTYLDGHTRSETCTEYIASTCVTDLYDPPANVLDAYNLLAEYCDTPLTLTPPEETI